MRALKKGAFKMRAVVLTSLGNSANFRYKLTEINFIILDELITKLTNKTMLA